MVKAEGGINKIIIIDGSMDVTGAFRSALYTAEALGGSGCVSFIIPKGSRVGDLLDEAGYDHEKMNLKSLRKKLHVLFVYVPYLLLDSWLLYRSVKQKRCRVIIVNDYSVVQGSILKLLGWGGNLYTFVRRIPSSQPSIISKLWIFISIRYSVRVLGVSKSVVSELPRSNKVRLLYNAAKYEERLPGEVELTKELYFCCPSNYMKDKGQADVLDAFYLASKMDDNIVLKFYGGDLGLKKNRLFRDSLVSRVRDLGLSDKVEINGFAEDMEKIIKESHVVLSCGYAESFSRICVEAGWFGRPVIATKCGGPQEIVKDGVTGLLVDVSDVEGIANAMLQFSRNRGLVSVMGSLAKEHVEKKFSYETFSRDLLSIIYEK